MKTKYWFSLFGPFEVNEDMKLGWINRELSENIDAIMKNRFRKIDVENTGYSSGFNLTEDQVERILKIVNE